MEASALIEQLEKIRAGYEKPPSQMEVIRNAVLRMSNPEHPELLNDEQRKVFTDRIDLLYEFLKTEDGADAIELLVCTFKAFCDSH